MRMKNRLINSDININKIIANHAFIYQTLVNLSYAWSFGSLIGLYFVLQILTGVFLGMHYISDTNGAFDSWLVRYMLANGASIIFILLYIHIGRGIYSQSYFYRQAGLCWSEMVIFLLMMATAFIGYVLPLGQMSFWGATVITSLITAIPKITTWLWSGLSLGYATLTRFFSIHHVLFFIMPALIILHLVILHQYGSTNPGRTTRTERVSLGYQVTNKNLFSLSNKKKIFLVQPIKSKVKFGVFHIPSRAMTTGGRLAAAAADQAPKLLNRASLPSHSKPFKITTAFTPDPAMGDNKEAESPVESPTVGHIPSPVDRDIETDTPGSPTTGPVNPPEDPSERYNSAQEAYKAFRSDKSYERDWTYYQEAAGKVLDYGSKGAGIYGGYKLVTGDKDKDKDRERVEKMVDAINNEADATRTLAAAIDNSTKTASEDRHQQLEIQKQQLEATNQVLDQLKKNESSKDRGSFFSGWW